MSLPGAVSLIVLLCGCLIAAGEAEPDMDAFVFGLGSIVFVLCVCVLFVRGNTPHHSSGSPGSSDGTPVLSMAFAAAFLCWILFITSSS